MRCARHRHARPSIATPQGSLNVVLHAHIPWVKRAGRWPFGEEWLFGAMLETYLPLLGLLDRLRTHGIRQALTVGVTPVLIEMLRDVYLTHAFDEYLESRLTLLEQDIASSESEELRSLAASARDGILAARRTWLHVYGRDLLSPLREAAERGEIEILTSAATHAYLPLLSGQTGLEMQLRTGIAATQSALGVTPAGIWLPECGYAPHLLPALVRCGFTFFYTDARAIRRFGAAPLGALSIPESSLAVYVRDPLANELVENAESGYPGRPWYREFHKRHERSGERYWRVTDRATGLGDKRFYEPVIAREDAIENAGSFVEAIAQRLGRGPGARAQLTLTFDAELFGHWWAEGFAWLEETLVQTAAAGIAFCSPARHLERHGPIGRFALGASSWGIGGDDRVWANTDTAYLWVELQKMESQLAERVHTGPHDSLCRTAARELLLAQSSDWPFQITDGGAAAYARQRFAVHRQRFLAAVGIENDDAVLAQARDADTCFAQIDLSPFAGAGSAV